MKKKSINRKTLSKSFKVWCTRCKTNLLRDTDLIINHFIREHPEFLSESEVDGVYNNLAEKVVAQKLKRNTPKKKKKSNLKEKREDYTTTDRQPIVNPDTYVHFGESDKFPLPADKKRWATYRLKRKRS